MVNNKIFKTIILVIIILVVAAVLTFLGFYLIKGRSNYAAVFLNNGFVYFGKLSTFPKLKLVNPIYFQVDQNGNPSIQRFADVFWQPKGVIYLNKQNIVFIAPIKNNSPLINFIDSAALTLPVVQQPLLQPQVKQQQLQPTQVNINEEPVNGN